MKATKSFVLAGAAALLGAWAALGVESEAFRVETRENLGGRVGTGVEWVGEVDGSGGRLWNTAEGADGWVTLESQGSVAEVCVLNEPAVEGGRLEGEMSWGADRVHVVRDDVVVGEGAVLTLERGAVVKFTPGAKIDVEEGGRVVAKGAYLADVRDDRAGGDTNLDGGATQPDGSEWWLEDGAVGNLRTMEWIGGGDFFKTTYSPGEKYGELPVPEEREDALFGGWFTGTGGTGTRLSPELNVFTRLSALYAYWVPLSLSVEPGSVEAAPAGGVYGASVAANAPWSAEAGADWISVEGGGDGAMSLRVEPNANTAARAATVRVRLAKGGIFRDVAVAQGGMERVATPVLRPGDGTTFEGSLQRVAASCGTVGAEIRYTLDGSEPAENAFLYEGSFNVFDTTTVKARAFKAGMLPSGTVVARLVRLRTLAEAIDQPLWTVTTDEANGWTVTEETTHDGLYAARSGVVGGEHRTRMKTSVEGEGWLRFWWKVACEDDPDGTGWDHLAFFVDDRLVDSIDGDSGWMEVAVKVKGNGVHSLAWEYAKDWLDENPTEDAGWVDQVTWEPVIEGGDVPMAWLEEMGLVEAGMSGEDAASADVDGDGFTAAQEYLAGTDPTDPDSLLLAGIDVHGNKADVSWTPNLGDEREYRVWAKVSMLDAEWVDVTDEADRSKYRFFCVEVGPVE